MGITDFINTGDTILSQGLTSGSSNPASAFVLGGPTFRTQQFGIDLSKEVRYALVNMSITPNQTKVNNLNVPQAFVFPVSPQNMQIARNSLVNWFETQGQVGTGSQTRFNVQRIVDLYGLTPMIFTIKGTTGYNKYYADGFAKSGTQWMQVLQAFIETYFQNLQNNPTQPNDLQFLDFWYQEFWHVVPIGPVVIKQTSERPLWMYYEINLAGTSRIQNPQASKQAVQNATTLTQSQQNLGILQQVMAGIVTAGALVGPYI